jgi:hypothetical protein
MLQSARHSAVTFAGDTITTISENGGIAVESYAIRSVDAAGNIVITRSGGELSLSSCTISGNMLTITDPASALAMVYTKMARPASSPATLKKS